MRSHQDELIDVSELDIHKIASIFESNGIDIATEIFIRNNPAELGRFLFRLAPDVDSWARIHVERTKIVLIDTSIDISKTKTTTQKLIEFLNILNNEYSMVKTYAIELSEDNAIMICIQYDIFFAKYLSIPDFVFQIRKFMEVHQLIIRRLIGYLN